MVEPRRRRIKTVVLSWLVWLALCVPAIGGVPCSVPNTLTNGTTADATQVMANYNAILACLTNAAAAGANSDITSLNALTTPIPASGGGTTLFIATAATGGAANAQTVVTTTPAVSGFSLTSNYSVYAKIGITNTGATTLAVGSTAATNVFKAAPGGPVALTGGELQIGDVAAFIFDGTQYELVNPHNQQGGVNNSVSIASAATTDIASTGSHYVSISGSTTITNFGNTLGGQTAFPRYLVTFVAAPLVTFNNTNCATNGGCIVTPGGVNIQPAAGDIAWLVYTGQGSNLGAGAGNWTIQEYYRAGGVPHILSGSPTLITSTGTYTPTVGMTVAHVECVGAGGAGGGAAATAAQVSFGGGGASGELRIANFTAAQIGASQTVTIGTGGTGVSGAAGNAGGNTTFGALMTANGGGGGATAAAGTAFTTAAGGTTSTGSGGISISGTPGRRATGADVSTTFAIGGDGAPGYKGQGSGAGYAVAGTAVQQAGIAATGFGAGGGGSANSTSQSAIAGAAGSNGVCYIQEYLGN